MSTISTTGRNAMLNALTALLNAGGAGSIQIATTSFGTILATMALSATSFGAAGAVDPGVATANAISSDNSTLAGEAAVYRLRSNAGATVITGTVGLSGADINFNSTTFVTAGICSITSLNITQPAS